MAKATKDKEAKPVPRVGKVVYDVDITLTEPMLGTVPYNKEIYAEFIEKSKPKEISEDETATVPERDEKTGWTGFHVDENGKGLFIYDYMVKGFMKNAASSLKEFDDVGKEEKGQKQLINNLVFVFPRRIFLHKKKGDGVLERPLRAQTMQGPRVTLVRSDQVAEGTKFKCEIIVLDGNRITEAKLRKWLDYGAFMGLGQFRNGSYGRFTYEMVKRR